jgi:hypothetical protein
MKGENLRRVLAVMLGLVGAMFGDFNVDDVEAQTTNSWKTGADGKWEIGANWLAGVPFSSGKTNALERTAGAAGSFSNNFAAIFTVTNTTGTATNYVDTGAATNTPTLYYRVRLVP